MWTNPYSSYNVDVKRGILRIEQNFLITTSKKITLTSSLSIHTVYSQLVLTDCVCSKQQNFCSNVQSNVLICHKIDSRTTSFIPPKTNPENLFI